MITTTVTQLVTYKIEASNEIALGRAKEELIHRRPTTSESLKTDGSYRIDFLGIEGGRTAGKMKKLIERYTKERAKAQKWVDDAGNDTTRIVHETKVKVYDKIIKDLEKMQKNKG